MKLKKYIINYNINKILIIHLTTLMTLLIFGYSENICAQGEATVFETIVKVEGSRISTDRQMMLLIEDTIIVDLESNRIPMGHVKLPVNAEITIRMRDKKPPQALKILLMQTKEINTIPE